MNLYMKSGVSEYWVVDPDDEEITIYLFNNKDIESKKTFKDGEKIRSNIFKDIFFAPGDIF